MSQIQTKSSKASKKSPRQPATPPKPPRQNQLSKAVRDKIAEKSLPVESIMTTIPTQQQSLIHFCSYASV